MKSFISNPKLIKEMGFESRKIAEKRFNVNNINDEIYQTLKMDNKLKKPKIFIISNQSFSLINFRISLMKLLYNYDLDVYALAPDYNEAHFSKIKKNNINFS